MYRKGTEKDCKAVYGLICALEDSTLPFTRFSDIYREQLRDRRYFCLVWEEGGEVMGVLNLRFEKQLHRAEKVAEILEFVVQAACRSRGIGKTMFDEACRIAEEAGCTRLEVDSNRRRADAHRFYLREGMSLTHAKFTNSLKSGLDEEL